MLYFNLKFIIQKKYKESCSMNILVTGGARGIGAGIVTELAKQGHSVAFCGRAAAETCAERLKTLRSEFSGKFEYYQS